jgi:adenosylmethionine-8-amino-7-oxononanoate aminotransferase/carbon monoxide dehydrogenase subunit G
MPRVTGERVLGAPPERVWTLLTDAEELARAMPGAGEVEPEDGRSFRTTISLAVGPVKDTYEGHLGYEDEQPPKECTIVVETKGRSGRLAGRGGMRLEPHDGEQTLLHYEGDFKVSGAVAGVGQRMIAGVARKTIERTLDGIGRRLGDEPRPAVEPEAEPTTAFWHPFANMAQVAGNELVIVRGEGAEVVDQEGRRYIDATAALWYCNVGYGRAEIAVAVESQLRELHAYSTFGAYANEPVSALAERVSALAPIPDGKVFFTSGGSDAVDTAAKLARRYWHAVGRPEKLTVIGRRHAYHGMHAWGTSLGGIPANIEGLGTLVADVVHVDASSVDELAAAIDRLGAEHVAAFIGEPVIGAGGVLPPPDGYWAAVTDVCRANDVLLIADEVITGFGRLGSWFGCSRFGLEPDLLVFAKGITSGYMPLGGVVVGPRVQEPFWSGEGTWFRHGYTYSGHAAACAAGLANLEILERERLVERVAELEPQLAEQVHALRDHALVDETRAIGLTAAVELDADALASEPRLLDRVVALSRQHGVLTRSLRGSALHVSPPFVITPEQIGALVGAFRAALDDVEREEVGSRPRT